MKIFHLPEPRDKVLKMRLKWTTESGDSPILYWSRVLWCLLHFWELVKWLLARVPRVGKSSPLIKKRQVLEDARTTLGFGRPPSWVRLTYRSWSSDVLCIISLSRALFLVWRPPVSFSKGNRPHDVSSLSSRKLRDWSSIQAVRRLDAREDCQINPEASKGFLLCTYEVSSLFFSSSLYLWRSKKHIHVHFYSHPTLLYRYAILSCYYLCGIAQAWDQ